MYKEISQLTNSMRNGMCLKSSREFFPWRDGNSLT